MNGKEHRTLLTGYPICDITPNITFFPVTAVHCGAELGHDFDLHGFQQILGCFSLCEPQCQGIVRSANDSACIEKFTILLREGFLRGPFRSIILAVVDFQII